MDQSVLDTLIGSATVVVVSSVWAFVAHKVGTLKWAKDVVADVEKVDPGLKVTAADVEKVTETILDSLAGKLVAAKAVPAPAAPAVVPGPVS